MKNRREKAALEAMMFTWGEPLEAKVAANVLSRETEEVYKWFLELQDTYEAEERGLRIRRVGKSFQFVSCKEAGDYVRKLCTPIKKRRLSQSALEVLAIIAYRQPVTRGEIEAIRGIKCERVIDGLVKRELVGEVGRSPGIGRPILYGTTKEFLQYLGIEDLGQLPDIEIEEKEENFKFDTEKGFILEQMPIEAIMDGKDK